MWWFCRCVLWVFCYLVLFILSCFIFLFWFGDIRCIWFIAYFSSFSLFLFSLRRLWWFRWRIFSLLWKIMNGGGVWCCVVVVLWLWFLVMCFIIIICEVIWWVFCRVRIILDIWLLFVMVGFCCSVSSGIRWVCFLCVIFIEWLSVIRWWFRMKF